MNAMNDINEKEEYIGWAQTEFPDLLQAEQNLDPYRSLWKLVRDFEKNMNLWKKEQVIFKLNADDIDKEAKFML